MEEGREEPRNGRVSASSAIRLYACSRRGILDGPNLTCHGTFSTRKARRSQRMTPTMTRTTSVFPYLYLRVAVSAPANVHTHESSPVERDR